MVRLLLVKNVAYDLANKKTMYGLINGLSNMYKTPSTANEVFLTRRLVNTKIKEGSLVIYHVNKCNSITST